MIFVKRKCYKESGIFFFNKNMLMSKFVYFRMLGVARMSFAGNIFERVYDYHIANSINLFKEYCDYYMIEFNEFEDFLEERYGLTGDINKAFCNRSARYKILSETPEKNAENLYYEETLNDEFFNFIGGVVNED